MHLINFLLYSSRPGGAGGSYMKQTGMVVVSRRGVNFLFWSHLRCSRQSTDILSLHGLVQGSVKKHRITRRETAVKFPFFFFLSFLSGLFQGAKFAYATPRWSPLGVKFKISDEHRRLFHIGVSLRVTDMVSGPVVSCLLLSLHKVWYGSFISHPDQ